MVKDAPKGIPTIKIKALEVKYVREKDQTAILWDAEHSADQSTIPKPHSNEKRGETGIDCQIADWLAAKLLYSDSKRQLLQINHLSS